MNPIILQILALTAGFFICQNKIYFKLNSNYFSSYS